MDNCGRMEPTHQELVERLEGGRYDRYGDGRKGNQVSLDYLSSATRSPSFKTVMELARSSASGMIITD